MGMVGFATEAGTRTGTVLVVDGSPAARQTLGALLRGRRLQPAFAHNAFEALTAMKRAAPDLVLLDVAIPGMSGLALLKIARARPQWGRTAFVVLGRPNDAAAAAEARRLGAAEYLVKSACSTAELVDLARRVVDRRGAEAEAS